MLIIPAIDLKDGQCVRLRQGMMDDSTVFSDDPVAVAARWVDAGCRRLHLVDLNGAFAGEPVNGDVVTAIAAAYPNLPIQIGGGIRNLDTRLDAAPIGAPVISVNNFRGPNPEPFTIFDRQRLIITAICEPAFDLFVAHAHLALSFGELF